MRSLQNELEYRKALLTNYSGRCKANVLRTLVSNTINEIAEIKSMITRMIDTFFGVMLNLIFIFSIVKFMIGSFNDSSYE